MFTFTTQELWPFVDFSSAYDMSESRDEKYIQPALFVLHQIEDIVGASHPKQYTPFTFQLTIEQTGALAGTSVNGCGFTLDETTGNFNLTEIKVGEESDNDMDDPDYII